MQHAILFLEGVVTFISPCHLPMLPVFLIYFAGGKNENSTGPGNEKTEKKSKTIVNILGFILGFTLVFITLGAFSGFFGGLLIRYETAVNIVTGAVVVVFGLNFLGLFNIFHTRHDHGNKKKRREIKGFFSAAIFGIVFSVSWTPCAGAFLGSALMMSSRQGSVLTGVTLLFCFSLGLGLPYLLSALLIDQLKSAFAFVKKNYAVINKICGFFLIIVGVLMAFGVMEALMPL